ncbi:hypothetical protein [Nitrosomonas sp. Is37]|uniref:hypothetical protein n=1 Tax=Nitrosomonas sp. Is37 TaxID=3080535 RepID=UPI00294B3E65|nr:hypothetical protein [Nitrosomonas sp. Is37]MDV6345187.1 hypothetical protein [Nitrosomonas sp. Is37]
MIDEIAKTSDNIISDRFGRACDEIERRLGKKCLYEHPELIGQYMLAGSVDYAARILERCLIIERATNKEFLLLDLPIEFRLNIFHSCRNNYASLRPVATEEERHRDLLVIREALGV